MPPNPTPTYQDSLNGLLPALAARGPDAPEVAAAAQAIRQQFPAQAADVDALLRVWRTMQGLASPPPSPSPALPAAPQPAQAGPVAGAGSWGPVATHGVTLAVGIVIALAIGNKDMLPILLSNLKVALSSPWSLLAVIAAAGAVGGFVNGYLAHSGAVLPSWHQLGADRYFLPGLLGNAAAGAIAAALAVWAPTWAAGANAGPALVAPAPVVLPSAVLVSSFVAGFGAARMVTGQRDKNLLWYAVEQALVQPSRPGAARQVNTTARSAQDVVAMTTGDVLPGAGAAATAAAATAPPAAPLTAAVHP
jgi:hypothetical protein